MVKMESWVHMLHLLKQPEERHKQFKNKNQPEIPENWTEWKPDNQGVKEATIN